MKVVWIRAPRFVRGLLKKMSGRRRTTLPERE